MHQIHTHLHWETEQRLVCTEICAVFTCYSRTFTGIKLSIFYESLYVFYLRGWDLSILEKVTFIPHVLKDEKMIKGKERMAERAQHFKSLQF